MHQLRFLMGLCPRPPGELTALPQAPELYLRGPTSKRRKGVDGRKGKGREREREGEGEGTGKKGKERGKDLPDQYQTASYAPGLLPERAGRRRWTRNGSASRRRNASSFGRRLGQGQCAVARPPRAFDGLDGGDPESLALGGFGVGLPGGHLRQALGVRRRRAAGHRVRVVFSASYSHMHPAPD